MVCNKVNLPPNQTMESGLTYFDIRISLDRKRCYGNSVRKSGLDLDEFSVKSR